MSPRTKRPSSVKVGVSRPAADQLAVISLVISVLALAGSVPAVVLSLDQLSEERAQDRQRVQTEEVITRALELDSATELAKAAAGTSPGSAAEAYLRAVADVAEPVDQGEEPLEPVESAYAGGESSEPVEPAAPAEPRNRLVEELAGREIGSRLRARHADLIARIEEADVDGAVKDALFKRAEALDPELWMTPEAVLEGVRNADALFEGLKSDVAHRSRR